MGKSFALDSKTFHTSASIKHGYAALPGRDVKLHYVISGPKDGTPVVLLHGWPQTCYEWRHLIPALADAGFFVIAPDTRGLGDSSRPLNGYDSQTRAADIAALLAHPDLAISRKYHLLGHDWGGPVAFALALTEKEHLLSLTIVDVTIPGLAVDISQGGKRWHHAFHLTPDLPEVLTNGREKEYLGWFYREFSANPAAFTESDEEEFLRTYRKPGAMRAGFSYYRNIPNDRDYFASATKGVTLGFPILAIGGGRTESRGRAGEVAQSLAGLGKIEERICETAGHFVPEDDPEWFNAEVLAFFTRVDGKK